MLIIISGLLTVFFLLAATVQQEVPAKFSCQDRAAGYYADVESGCQIYHMCDGLGRQFSYSCPNTTLFQQRMLICDHWYMVNCSRSEIDYAANLLIGQQKPFVEDSEQHPYYRTPRPDLLAQTDFNKIYRNGRAQNHTTLNLVGINSDYDQNNGSSKVTERPAYHLPSHWSTEYIRDGVTPSAPNSSRQVIEAKETNTTPLPNSLSPSINSPRESQGSQGTIISSFATSFAHSSNINSESHGEVYSDSNIKLPLDFAIPKINKYSPSNLDKIKNTNYFPKKEIAVNFKSAFKATTPVFPTKEELGTTEIPIDDILIAPGSITSEGTDDKIPAISVNFKSMFKATTPVFPTKEELITTESPLNGILIAPNSDNYKETNSTLENAIIINFNSLFKATTPVFPTKEELLTTESPVNDLQPPISKTQQIFSTDTSPVPVTLLNSGIQIPSNALQLPNLQPGEAIEENNAEQNKYVIKSNKNKNKPATRLSNEKVLKDLRKMFSIPDYEFPLDSVSRPNYEQTLDSFHVNPFLGDVKQRAHASDR